ncbi:MAG: histidine phosphatase family protein [Patescibacteria group bacterium]|jgi:broad specificity phosphatase PhoE
MTRIFLIRHGHVDNPENIFNGPSRTLSERGQRQIEALAEDFKSMEILPTRILCSPFVRTRQTADILSSAFGTSNATPDERLIEWQNVVWWDKPLKEFHAHTHYDQHPNAELPPDIESLDACATRVQSVLHDLVRDADRETLFVVGHREPFASAILRYQGKDFTTIRTLHLPHACAWELGFNEPDQPSVIERRFDRSSLK